MVVVRKPFKIGVFDSGVGGLSVIREIRKQLPQEDILFIADQAHVPYGPRPLIEVRDFADAITRYLIDQGARLVVVACNAASAAALHELRKTYPQILFVGMEPAVKPAAETTHTGKVGVLATPATFQGALYNSVVERFASGVTLLTDTCPGLVHQIETGNLEGSETRLILVKALRPMLEQGIDTIVLGCTHYPFVIPLIQNIAGPHVRVIDPAPAVARQVERVFVQLNLPQEQQKPQHGKPRIHILTTGEPRLLRPLVYQLTGFISPVKKLSWTPNGLTG